MSVTPSIGSGFFFGSATSFTAKTGGYKQYIGPNMSGNQNPGTVPSLVSIPVPQGGQLGHLTVMTDGADAGTLGTTNSLVITVVKLDALGGVVPGGPTCTLNSLKPKKCEDYSSTLSISSGERLALEINGISTKAASVSFSNLTIQWSMTLSGD
jgi:hypothetical protein